VATGWLLWLTWAYVALFALGIVLDAASIIAGRNIVGALLGIDAPGLDHISVWWVLGLIPGIAFAIGCVGMLLHDRDFAWVAVVAAWVIVVKECITAFLLIFHLRLSIPISAFIYAAFAIQTVRLLRPRKGGRALTDRGVI
jgi:hypothetical protein